jgi:hypothetical protein
MLFCSIQKGLLSSVQRDMKLLASVQSIVYSYPFLSAHVRFEAHSFAVMLSLKSEFVIV